MYTGSVVSEQLIAERHRHKGNCFGKLQPWQLSSHGYSKIRLYMAMCHKVYVVQCINVNKDPYHNQNYLQKRIYRHNTVQYLLHYGAGWVCCVWIDAVIVQISSLLIYF